MTRSRRVWYWRGAGKKKNRYEDITLRVHCEVPFNEYKVRQVRQVRQSINRRLSSVPQPPHQLRHKDGSRGAETQLPPVIVPES